MNNLTNFWKILFKMNVFKHSNKIIFIGIGILYLIIFCLNPIYGNQNNEKSNQEIFNTLTYDELVSLSKSNELQGKLKSKVDYVMNTIAIDNTISTSPKLTNESPALGKFLRLASWNIERGMKLDDILMIFHNPQQKSLEVNLVNPTKANLVREQMESLRLSDVLLLTEVDAGMPRTKYRNIVEEFAKSIGYNYAYAIEFLEIDPAHLGLEDYKWSEERVLFPNRSLIIDKDKYKGLHGTAILSKFPLKNVQLIRLPECYDWYNGEKKRLSKTEDIKRYASSKLVGENTIREVRYGSRIALMADIEVPGLDSPITLVATHIENRTTPEMRVKQLKELLNKIYNIRNPVVVAGDFNTINTAERIKRAKSKFIKEKEKFLEKNPKINQLSKNLFEGKLKSLQNILKNSNCPTIKKFIDDTPGPSEDDALFDTLQNFQFADGNYFDFRGIPGKTYGQPGELGNSNERGIDDFILTYKLQRSFYIGRYKLDWIFVKAYNNKANDSNCSYRMAPHFGRTFFDLTYAFKEPLSDHVPVIVDLPLFEPAK